MLADRTLRTAAVIAASLALVACGETNRIKPTDKATPRVPATIKPTVNPAPTTPPAPPSESGSVAPTTAAPTSAGSPNGVQAAGVAFTPKALTVKAGTKVTWTAASGETHSVNSGEPGKQEAGPLNAPIGFTTYAYTFTKAGTYKYFCVPHGGFGMVGEIVVT